MLRVFGQAWRERQFLFERVDLKRKFFELPLAILFHLETSDCATHQRMGYRSFVG